MEEESKPIRLNEFFCDNLWRWKIGMEEIDYDKRDVVKPGEFPDLKDAFKKPKEFIEIEKLADNRMLQGTFRYGEYAKQNHDKYDLIKEVANRLKIYEQTGNLEYVVDAYNMVRMEFARATRKGKKLISIDDGYHAKPVK